MLLGQARYVSFSEVRAINRYWSSGAGRLLGDFLDTLKDSLSPFAPDSPAIIETWPDRIQDLSTSPTKSKGSQESNVMDPINVQ
jgi:hypothetical protein